MLGIRTSPYRRPCNEKKASAWQWHWPMNQPHISLPPLGLFFGRRTFAFRRRGLFFRLGSGSAVRLFRCALARCTRLRSTFFGGRALVGSRRGSWFAGRVRFRSGTNFLRFGSAFLGSTCLRSTLFGSGLVRFWRWFAGCVRLGSWTSFLCFWCAFLGRTCSRSTFFRGGLAGFRRGSRLAGCMRLRAFFARSV